MPKFKIHVGEIKVILAFKDPSIVCQTASYDSFCQIGSHMYIYSCHYKQFVFGKSSQFQCCRYLLYYIVLTAKQILVGLEGDQSHHTSLVHYALHYNKAKSIL